MLTVYLLSLFNLKNLSLVRNKFETSILQLVSTRNSNIKLPKAFQCVLSTDVYEMDLHPFSTKSFVATHDLLI